MVEEEVVMSVVEGVRSDQVMTCKDSIRHDLDSPRTATIPASPDIAVNSVVLSSSVQSTSQHSFD